MSDTLREAEKLLKTILSSNARLSSLRGKTEPPDEAILPESSLPETPKTQEGTASAFSTDIGVDIADDIGDDTSPESAAEPRSLEIDIDPPPVQVWRTTAVNVPGAPLDHSFSFLDLIPSDPDIPETGEPEPDREPIDTPPPVRAKPIMPLPLGLAAGAPTAPVLQVAPTPRPQPATPVEPVGQDTPSYSLSAPRAVSAQILDPERERLEVEVVSEEDTEPDQPELPLPDAPRLTEPTPTQTRPRPTPVVPTEHPDEAIFDALTQAKASIRRGDLVAANGHLSDVLDWEPSHVEARLTRGRCSRDIGDPIAAMSDFEKAIQVAPFSPEAHVEMGDLFFARKDYGRAILHYTDAIERDPNHPMALCRRGICYHYRQRPENALDDLKSARLVAPDIPNIDRYVRMVSTPQTR
jgi:hypothetical protein